MRDTITELWVQIRITTSFQYYILCVLIHSTQKLQVVYRRSTYWMTTLLSEIFIFCVGAGCKIWLVSYGSKQTLQSICNKPFVHTYMCNLKTTGHIWTFCISNNCSTIGQSKTFLECLRVAGRWGPDTYCISHSLIQHCVRTCKPVPIWCTTTRDNKTHIPYDCILHSKQQFYHQWRTIS